MKSFRSFGVAALVLILGGSSFAMARGHGRDHDRDDRNRRDRRVVWVGRHDRDHRRFEGRRDERHFGWTKGRKSGWGNCDLPPGQAKKAGCYEAHGHRHHRRSRGYVVVVPRRPMSTRPVSARKPSIWNHATQERQAQVQAPGPVQNKPSVWDRHK